MHCRIMVCKNLREEGEETGFLYFFMGEIRLCSVWQDS